MSIEQTKPDCPHCGSSKHICNIHLSLNNKGEGVGLSFRRMVPVVIGTEPFLADMCQDCGTIVRLHVKETDRKWHINE